MGAAVRAPPCQLPEFLNKPVSLGALGFRFNVRGSLLIANHAKT